MQLRDLAGLADTSAKLTRGYQQCVRERQRRFRKSSMSERRYCAFAPVSSIEELIALFAKGRCAVMSAAQVYIWPGDSTIRLVDGHISGPRPDGDTITDEIFANEHIRSFACEQNFDLLVPPGSYYRWTNNPDEAKQAEAGTLRPSRNHLVNREEDGLSVAEGPWLYCLTNSFCWFVQGEKIGHRGSDGEPLLDSGSLIVDRGTMTRRRLLTLLHERNRDRISMLAKETGVPPVELFALLIGLH
jgi:hypothetical protein